MRYLEKILAPIGFDIKRYVSVCVAKDTHASVSVTKVICRSVLFWEHVIFV